MTGYTYIISEGATFEQYFKKCCQAFLYVYRSEASSLPIEEAIKKQKKDCEDQLLDAKNKYINSKKNLSKDLKEINKNADSLYAEYCKPPKEKESKNLPSLKDMLTKVQAYNPPKKLESIKAFMLKQIEESIFFETPRTYTCNSKGCILLSKEAYITQLKENRKSEVDYYKNDYNYKKKKFVTGNKWFDLLLKELKKLNKGK